MPSANSDGIARAFMARKRATGNNTICDGHSVFLHGNRIAWWDENGVPWISFCGWATKTTVDRLSAILDRMPGQHTVRFKRDGTAIYNGMEVDSVKPIPLVGPLGALALNAELAAHEA